MELVFRLFNAVLLATGLLYGAVYYGMCQRHVVPNRRRDGESTVYRLRSIYTVPVIVTVIASATLMSAPLLNVPQHPLGALFGLLCGCGAWRLVRVTDRHRELTVRLVLRCVVILLTWVVIDVMLGGQPHLTRTSAWMVGLANVPALVVLSLHATGVHENWLIGQMRTARLGLRIVALVTLLTMHPWARRLCSHGCTPTLDWVWGHQSTYVLWVLASLMIAGTSVVLWCSRSSSPRYRKGA